MFAPHALVSTVSPPLTATKVYSLRRGKGKFRKHFTVFGIFARSNDNISLYPSDSASDTQTADHLYDWAREDQLQALNHRRRRREARGVVDRQFLHAHDSDEEEGSEMSWSQRDQMLTLRNNAVKSYVRRTAEDCSISWMDTDVVDHGECVHDVNEVMMLLKHADTSETQEVVDALIEAGGSKAAEAISAWIDLNPDQHATHAAAVRKAMMVNDDEKELRRRREEGEEKEEDRYTMSKQSEEKEEKLTKKKREDEDDESGAPLRGHFAGLYNAGFIDYGGLVAPLPLGVPIGTFFPPPTISDDSK